jgi:hypothetical protein
MQRFAVLEVFAGSAGVTLACAELGLQTLEPWDWMYGSQYDVSIARNKRKLYRILESGTISCVWFGTPCSTYSSARKFDDLGPPPIRSFESPDQAAPWCSKNEIAQVEASNLLTGITACAIQIAHRSGAAFVLENPKSSLIWRVPQLSDVLEHCNAKFVTFTHCAFGSDLRKPTTLASTLPNIDSLHRSSCSGLAFCSITGMRHSSLRGKANGVFRTQRGAAYPPAFCAAAAGVIRDWVAADSFEA